MTGVFFVARATAYALILTQCDFDWSCASSRKSRRTAGPEIRRSRKLPIMVDIRRFSRPRILKPTRQRWLNTSRLGETYRGNGSGWVLMSFRQEGEKIPFHRSSPGSRAVATFWGVIL